MNEIEKTAEDVAAAAQLEPIVAGVTKIAEGVARSEKRISERVEDVEKKSARQVEDLEGKVNKSVEAILGRIEDLKKHSTAFSHLSLGITPGNDILKGLVGKEYTDRSGEYERYAKAQPKDSALADPMVAMATTEWFALSTKRQLQRFMGSNSEIAAKADKLYEAMQEYHLGADWKQKASLQEDTTSEGGYLIPTIVEADILRLVKDAGQIFPRGRQIPMRTKIHKVPNEATAVTLYWVEEEGALTQGEPVFGETTLTAEKVAVRAKMSVELVQDSAPGLLQYLLEVFTEKIAGELDKQMVLGDGSGPQITGIMSATGITAITSATATGRSLTYPLLVSTFCGAGESQPRVDGVWICSPKGYAQILSLADSNGMPIVQFGNVPNAPAGTILGRPIIVSNRLGGALTLDDITNTVTKIIFGPLNALLCGTRMGMQWGVTDQVGWANFQIDCRLLGRFAGNVGVPAAFTYLGQVDYTA